MKKDTELDKALHRYLRRGGVVTHLPPGKRPWWDCPLIHALIDEYGHIGVFLPTDTNTDTPLFMDIKT